MFLSVVSDEKKNKDVLTLKMSLMPPLLDYRVHQVALPEKQDKLQSALD